VSLPKRLWRSWKGREWGAENLGRRRFPSLASTLAFALVIFGCTLSQPAVACLCNCSIFSSWGEDSTDTEVGTADYDQVFSGLILSTERIREPLSPAVASGETFVDYQGYWIRSRILVFRTWQGAPSTVAEVWTPVVSSCDVPPSAGFHFVALVRTEKGRRVADNTYCDCVLKAAATKRRGAFTAAGIAVTAAAVSAAALALLWLVKIIRRRRAVRMNISA
jgi:hypothetical protein